MSIELILYLSYLGNKMNGPLVISEQICQELLSKSNVNQLRLILFQLIPGLKTTHLNESNQRVLFLWLFLSMNSVDPNVIKEREELIQVLNRFWSYDFFHPFLGVSGAEELLKDKSNGTQIIRLSTTTPGMLTISIKVETGVYNIRYYWKHILYWYPRKFCNYAAGAQVLPSGPIITPYCV